jgi:hypothetical protein
MRHKLVFAIVGVAALFFNCMPSWAEDQPDAAALAKVLPEATVSLKQGLKATQPEGTPISAKFEIEDGALQLSVYTMNRDQFTEVIVDHWMGDIAKAEPITSGGDLKAAGEQGAAMAKAQMKLAAAVDRAVAANSGYLAVEVEPKLEGGRPIAVITLTKGQDVKKVPVTLD